MTTMMIEPDDRADDRAAGPVVHLIDDEPAVRRALARLLAAAGYRSEGHGSAEEFLAHRDPGIPGCAIVDLCLPGSDGLDLQARLAAAPSAPPLIFLTGRGDLGASVRAMKGGAVDFLTKPVEAEALLAAVGDALALDHRARAAHAAQAGFEDRFGLLTPREREVLEGVVAGQLSKQIAAELGVAEKTVKVHRGRLMQKMQARTIADLVRQVVTHRG